MNRFLTFTFTIDYCKMYPLSCTPNHKIFQKSPNILVIFGFFIYYQCLRLSGSLESLYNEMSNWSPLYYIQYLFQWSRNIFDKNYLFFSIPNKSSAFSAFRLNSALSRTSDGSDFDLSRASLGRPSRIDQQHQKFDASTGRPIEAGGPGGVSPGAQGTQRQNGAGGGPNGTHRGSNGQRFIAQ